MIRLSSRCSKREKPIEIKQVNISQPLLGHEQGQVAQTASQESSGREEVEMLAVSAPVKTGGTERSSRGKFSVIIVSI